MLDPIVEVANSFVGLIGVRGPRVAPDRIFESYAKMVGMDVAQLDPAVVREAAANCAQCACRKACRRWLRTGVFNYSGSGSCANAALLQ